jgi:hypothetical protein
MMPEADLTAIKSYNVLAALHRILPELPLLFGPVWSDTENTLLLLYNKLNTSPASVSTAFEILGVFSRSPAALDRINQEMQLQEYLQSSILLNLGSLSLKLGLDPQETLPLVTVPFQALSWNKDDGTKVIPSEATLRRIFLEDGNLSTSTSVKLSNIRIDFEELLEISAGTIITGVSIYQTHQTLMVVASLLLTLGVLYKQLKLKIDDQETSVFLGFIKACDNKKEATQTRILHKTNAERRQIGLSELSVRQCLYSLQKLQKIKAVRLIDSGKGLWQIRESFSIKEDG